MTPAQRDNLIGAHSAAMARIAELEAERDRLRKANGEMALFNADMQTENALLRKALEDTRRIVQVFAIEFEQAARIPEAAK